jgi:hypothetical protein
VQFERKCARIGAEPRTILEPYKTEVRIKRNDAYLIGAQVVQLQANFNSSAANSIEVKCTGYLNYFKDRYVSEEYTGMTYAEIAAQLITDTQDQANGDFGVTLGVDEASEDQSASRERNYDLQEVKDGIQNLTKLESDNFEFQFTHDKVFNMYTRLGSDKPGVLLTYPLNITNMSVIRDASTLANKIYTIGSGIGEERLQITTVDTTSAIDYKIREKKIIYNSVNDMDTLQENALGDIPIYKDIYEMPTLNVSTEALDLNEVGLGDAVTVSVEGSTFIDNIDGLYRIVGIAVNVSKNNQENIALKLRL